MAKLNTKKRTIPVCPWCESELDAAEFDFDSDPRDILMDDGNCSIDVMCPECGETLSVIAELVYTTKKSNKLVEQFEDYDEDNDDEDDEGEYGDNAFQEYF